VPRHRSEDDKELTMMRLHRVRMDQDGPTDGTPSRPGWQR
jgi:hypothetical protein